MGRPSAGGQGLLASWGLAASAAAACQQGCWMRRLLPHCPQPAARRRLRRLRRWQPRSRRQPLLPLSSAAPPFRWGPLWAACWEAWQVSLPLFAAVAAAALSNYFLCLAPSCCWCRVGCHPMHQFNVLGCSCRLARLQCSRQQWGRPGCSSGGGERGASWRRLPPEGEQEETPPTKWKAGPSLWPSATLSAANS